MSLPASTLHGLESTAQDVHGLWARRAFLSVLALVLVAGLAGFLGVRTARASDSSEGWTLDLEYARVARGGLDVPFTATIGHEGGFDDKVTLALTGTYLDVYETQGFHPEPDSTSRDGSTLYLTFETPPSGDSMVVSYDAYVQPPANGTTAGTLSVLDQGTPVVSVDLETTVLP